MVDPNPVRGYRVLADRKVEKQYSVNNLLLNKTEAEAYSTLNKAVGKAELAKERGVPGAKGVPCVGRAEEFSGDNLLSERDAQLACAGCPVFAQCDIVRLVARPAHGVYAGVRKNMEIPND